MPEEVKYTMSLNDLVTPKIDNADKHVQKFESSLHKAHSALGQFGSKILQVGEYLGISFAFVKFEEFFREGTELVHKFDIAEGQLQNTLKNVGERAGLSAEQLVAMAQKMQHEIPFTTDKIVDMENSLSRFGNMTPKVYQQVLTMSADIATALKRDGADVANTLGRIMEKPAENGRLLRQLNITLTAEDRKYLLQLEKTGQTAKAQTFIFQELATKGYGGAAKAAANSDPLFRYNKAIYELEMQIGEVGIALEETFAPGLEAVSNAFSDALEYGKEFYGYLKDNKETVAGMVVVVGSATAAWLLYQGVLKGVAAWEVIHTAYLATKESVMLGYMVYMTAVSEGTGFWTAAQWGLNAAFTANPIGIVVVAVGAFIGLIYEAYQHCEVFRAVLDGIGRVAYDVAEVFVGLGKAIVGAFTNNFSLIKSGIKDIANGAGDVGVAFQRGFTESMAQNELEEQKRNAAKKPNTIKPKEKVAPGSVVTPKSPGTTTKATGSKVLNINIKIDNVIKEFTIKTTNFKEGIQKAQDMVSNSLLSALNDSQLAADI